MEITGNVGAHEFCSSAKTLKSLTTGNITNSTSNIINHIIIKQKQS